ncbi:hypothetical protein DL767_003692 [Monosporascus sp. MG133]|nr:hypothetical protein DL767_003692 [Monosporascus sp. MG133]
MQEDLVSTWLFSTTGLDGPLSASQSPMAKNEDLGHDRLGEEFAQEKTPASTQHLGSIVTGTVIAKALQWAPFHDQQTEAQELQSGDSRRPPPRGRHHHHLNVCDVKNLRSLGRGIRHRSRSSIKSTRSDFPAPPDGKERRLLSRYPVDTWPSSGDETPIYNTPEPHNVPFLQNFPTGSYIEPLATAPVAIATRELDRLSSQARRSRSRSEAALSDSSATVTVTRQRQRRRTASRLSEVMYT